MGSDPTLAYDAPTAARRRSGAEARAVFGQTMGLVAFTLGFFALGAYIGRDLAGVAGIACFVGALILLLGLNVAVHRSEQLAIAMLFGVGLLLGMGMGPVLYAYLQADPAAVWQAGGATAIFVAGLGSFGYATRRDLSGWARTLFFLLLGFLALTLVMLFVSIPGANVIWALLGLGLFGAYTVFDFNRLRRAGMASSVPIAAGIFIDVVNIFQFFLMLFGGGRS